MRVPDLKILKEAVMKFLRRTKLVWLLGCIIIVLFAVGLVGIGRVMTTSLSQADPDNSLMARIVAKYSNRSSSGAFEASSYPMFTPPVSGPETSVGICSPIPDSCTGNAHKGPDLYAIDYFGTEGVTAIHPTLAGRVVYANCLDPYGCVVAIRHWDDQKWDHKYYSIYAHMQSIDPSLVSLWKLVDPSTVIGYMGKTGSGANGIVHLHFAVRVSNDVYDLEKALYGQSAPGGVIYTDPFNVRQQFNLNP